MWVAGWGGSSAAPKVVVSVDSWVGQWVAGLAVLLAGWMVAQWADE